MNYSHGYIVGRAASGALWLKSWEHTEYDDGLCIYDEYPVQFGQLAESRNQVLRAGMALSTDETIKLIYVNGRGYISTEKHEAEQTQAREAYECLENVPRKPYTTPTIKQLYPMPLEPLSTVWHVANRFKSWGFASGYEVYDFLKMAKGAGASLDGLIVVMGHCLAQAFKDVPKEAQS